MKKIAVMLALVLVMSSCMCIFASADPVLTADPSVYYGLDAEGSAWYSEETVALGTLEVMGPADIIAVTITFDTDGQGFAGQNTVIHYDPTKLQLLDFDAENWQFVPAVGDPTNYYLPQYNNCFWGKDNLSDNWEEEIFGGPVPVLPHGTDAAGPSAGRLGTAHGQASNYKSKGKDITSGTAMNVFFEPITEEACTTTITVSYFEIGLDDGLTVYNTTGGSVDVKLNGGAVEKDPIVSLGAKANANYNNLGVALRFGAEYNKTDAIVEDLGMLLYPSAKLGTDTLDLDYAAANALVAKVRAAGIEGYVEGQAFEAYATFNFYVNLVGLAGHEDAEITAVPFILYDDGTAVYGDVMAHSYNSVVEAAA